MSGRSTSRRLRSKVLEQQLGPHGQGKAAYKANKPLGANPYGSPDGNHGKAHSWAKGWLEGMREHH